ncbi:MAG TPA: M1 family metallopeptidase [Anaerolineales bacterium]|jgi:hypothetical protein|nr:M1 family metallopeptidase [Anaerolineales bacterium]
MKIRAFLLIFCVAGLFLGACWPLKDPEAGPSGEPQPGDVSSKEEPDRIIGTPSSTLESHPGQIPTPEKALENPESDQFQGEGEPASSSGMLTKYLLDASFDYGDHHLAVEEEIHYTNRASESLNDLVLNVEPSRYPDTFHLNSLTSGDGETVVDYEREIGSIRLNLPNPLGPGKQITLQISYDLNLPSPDSSFYGRPVPFGYTSRQTNLVDWYPFIPPYIDGQGWLSRPAGAFGEYLAYEVADFDVSIRLEDPSENLTLAASAPAVRQGDITHYTLESARSFAWSASPLYEVRKQQVGDITVVGYSFPIHADAGEEALNTTAKALELYSRLFGPYPHQTLSVVEADFLDGMEYDGLYFLSNGFYNLYDGSQGEYLVAIAAHETAHQWFYGLVGNDQAVEPWLDEALCTYSERLYYETTAPEALDWWYAYRIDYYDPKGWVDGSIYNPEGYRAYRDAVYLNGALFLDDLRSQIGNEAFFAFLKDYVRRFTHKIATGDDFFILLASHTQKDLTALVGEYFSSH